MMPSSFRFVLSALSFPAWRFGLPAPPPGKPETPEILPPKTENLLGKCRAPNAFRSHRGNKGFFYRGETGRQMSVHQVRFSSVREPTTTTEGRNKEELLKNCCVGCRKPVLGLGTHPPHSFDRGDRSIDQSIEERLQASDSIAGSREGSESLKW